ncbi:hypothetical protein GCM10017044_09760 [Kordiimonas sediminis]|uniref:FAD-binding oxidoreductase n=1 Tax=Kordiimonas sediminis TaxID=1735581 RepID=A0A919ANQ5_9PROT|nr:pyridoxamine 5'-phosphate oxidase family protein [Kordiimonas sediminis]GHF17430.1 hypothetical protein GCM10017044_09760 [Kordiimonas sediminis]
MKPDHIQATAIKRDDSPFHEGELEIQERVGVREQIHQYAPRVIRNYMPDQHRDFFAGLSYLVVGVVDRGGWPIASILFGDEGCISSPSPVELVVQAVPVEDDPIAVAIVGGADIGVLGIELHTRRRNRMSGRIFNISDQGFSIGVMQSFGNCPQYIQTRFVDQIVPRTSPVRTAPTDVTKLNKAMQTLVAEADTFFIASAYQHDPEDRRSGVDVSHRGGKPGFVEILDETTLIFPDFSGNKHFNTLGNILKNPKVGLVFPDFQTGDLLYIQGEAGIIWHSDLLDAFSGAERLVSIQVKRARLLRGRMPFRWHFQEYSPALAFTGSWQAAEAMVGDNNWEPYVVRRIVAESATIISLYLERQDGEALAPYRPGQHLPICLSDPTGPDPIRRSYSLSTAFSPNHYRISVKREERGRASALLHDQVQPGSVVHAKKPQGSFFLETKTGNPIILLSAGVGITPMIAMLNALLAEEMYAPTKRPVYFLHAARNSDEQAFKKLLKDAETLWEQVSVFTAFSRPLDHDIQGQDYMHEGHFTAAVLESILGQVIQNSAVNVYLCGPSSFMADMTSALTALGVSGDRILTENFGPASLPAIGEMPDAEVVLLRSGTAGIWSSKDGPLLDYVTEKGVDVPYSCRSGSCGSCRTRLVAGTVKTLVSTNVPLADDEILLCCSVPDQSGDLGTDTGKIILDI